MSLQRIRKNIVNLKYVQKITKKQILQLLDNKPNLKNRDPYETLITNSNCVTIKFKNKLDTGIQTFYLINESNNSVNECILDEESEKRDDIKLSFVNIKTEDSKKKETLSTIQQDKKNDSPNKFIMKKKKTETPPKQATTSVVIPLQSQEQKTKAVIQLQKLEQKTTTVIPLQEEIIDVESVVWRRWQQTLFDSIKEPLKREDGRSVVWYYDPLAGTGKTFFSDIFPLKCKKKVIKMDDSVIGDMEKLFETYKRETHPQAFILNITNAESKSTSTSTMFYSNLEKYSDFFRNSFFIVFSNTFPMLDGLSMNRWIIRRSPKVKECLDKECVEVDGRKITNRDAMVRRVYDKILIKQNKREVTDEYKKLMRDQQILNFYLKPIFEKKIKPKKEKSTKKKTEDDDSKSTGTSNSN